MGAGGGMEGGPTWMGSPSRPWADGIRSWSGAWQRAGKISPQGAQVVPTAVPTRGAGSRHLHLPRARHWARYSAGRAPGTTGPAPRESERSCLILTDVETEAPGGCTGRPNLAFSTAASLMSQPGLVGGALSW